jgi:hydrogenase nickel incorporation protein HypA/HybF
MHEVGIMHSAMEIAERQAREAGAESILKIHMRIGRMSGIVPEALETAFLILKEGTMAQEGSMEIESVAGVCYCADCAAEFEAQGLYADCPRCGTPSMDIRAGTEMELVSLEVL